MKECHILKSYWKQLLFPELILFAMRFPFSLQITFLNDALYQQMCLLHIGTQVTLHSYTVMSRHFRQLSGYCFKHSHKTEFKEFKPFQSLVLPHNYSVFSLSYSRHHPVFGD